MNNPATRWPKSIPTLTPEQQAIREDFMHYWHDVLPKRYGLLERFNHRYPRAQRRDWQHTPVRTLEVGAGFGAHIGWEDLSFQEYTALELRESMAERIRSAYPQVKTLVGDIQQRIPAPDGHFDRVVAVHVLEHLPALPSALQEMSRVLAANGRLSFVLPCEGGMMYELARTISSRRLFEKRYGCSYDWFIKSEHVNTFSEIMEELRRAFKIVNTSYFPFIIPNPHLNVVVGVTCMHRPS